MNIFSAVIFLGMIAVLCLSLWSLVANQRSAVAVVIAVVVALLAAGGAWYAWAESKSIPWTIGYGVVALACAASAMRLLFGARSPKG